MASKGDQMGADVLSKHMSTKVHTWRGKYGRIWALTPSAVQNVDPGNFSITNSWPWAEVVDFAPAVSSVTDFTFTVRAGKKTEILKYAADHRAALLCDLQRYASGPDGAAGARRFMAVKLTRHSSRAEAILEVGSWYVACLAPDGRRLSLYPFKEVAAVKQLRDDPSALLIYAGGRPHLFATPERGEVLRLLSAHLTKLGLTALISDVQPTAAEYRAERLALGNDGAPRIAEFEVLKHSSKAPAPRPRRLVITETCVTERDAGTYAVVSSRQLASVHALTRHWDDPQRLTIEFRDGSTRSYSCSLREALLGSLLDGARNATAAAAVAALPVSPTAAAGSSAAAAAAAASAAAASVTVQAELHRPGDRLAPPAVEDDPEIAGLYLAHMQRQLKSPGAGGSGAGSGAPYNSSFVRACAEFNANVSPLGLAYGTKKGPVAAVLPDLLAELVAVQRLGEEFPASIIVTLLEALQRLLGAKEGYKLFLTLTEAPSVLAAAIGHDDDGVAFAGLEALRRACHNPRRPHDADEDVEAAAKKVLLSTEVRVAIIQCLDVHSGGGSGSTHDGAKGAAGAPGSAAAAAAAAGSGGGPAGGLGAEGTLVMLGITSLLDSVLVSHVDTTPPEAAEHLMQLTASRYFALLSLFRCHCAGIVESAALLMRAMVEQADEGTVRAMQVRSLPCYSSRFSPCVPAAHLYVLITPPVPPACAACQYLLCSALCASLPAHLRMLLYSRRALHALVTLSFPSAGGRHLLRCLAAPLLQCHLRSVPGPALRLPLPGGAVVHRQRHGPRGAAPHAACWPAAVPGNAPSQGRRGGASGGGGSRR